MRRTIKSSPRAAGVLIPDKPFGFAGGTVLSIQLKHNMAFSKCGIGRFRISLTSMPDPNLVVTVPAKLRKALDLAPAERTEKQTADLAAAYRILAPLLSRSAIRRQNWRSRTPIWESPPAW